MTPDPDNSHTSTDGQPLGERGARTRQRILEAVADGIEQQGLRGLRLADLAAEVGFSPPAFYQYFNDVDDAILALCEEVGELLPDFEFDGEDWDDSPQRSTRLFVARYFEYWNRHRALLFSRNVAVTAGDERFRIVRDEAYRPMAEALRARIEKEQRTGQVPASVSPVAVGAILTVMLDRVCMLSPQLQRYWGANNAEQLIDALAYVFDRVLGSIDHQSESAKRASRGTSRAAVKKPRRSRS